MEGTKLIAKTYIAARRVAPAMACVRLQPPTAPPRPVEPGELTYQDVIIDGPPPGTASAAGPPVVPAGTSAFPQAQKTISVGGGNIIDDASQYFVGVQRMSFCLDVPLCIPPKLLDAAGDWVQSGGQGVTAWSFTLSYTNAGVTTFSEPDYIRVPNYLAGAPAGATPSHPDFDCAFWNLQDFILEVNRSLARAYADLAAKVAGLAAIVRAPFFSLSDPGSGRMSLTVYPASEWMSTTSGGGAPMGLFCNWAARIAFTGFPLLQGLSRDVSLPASGLGWLFRVYGDGLNFQPPNAVGAESTAPTNPATTRVIIQATQPPYLLPSVTKIALLSSLPVVGEFTGEQGETQKVVDDFNIDTSQFLLGDQATRYVYSPEGLAGVRWLKMTSGSPVSSFTLRVETVDWQGVRRPFRLQNGNQITLKLAFAPNRLVETR